jgi:hypothetical protein
MEPKFYDSRGIIPGSGEDQHLYIVRALVDLDVLQRFHHDIMEKKVGRMISTGSEKVVELLIAGNYAVLDTPAMEQYGFEELPFPAISIDTETYNQIFSNKREKSHLRGVATNIPVTYDGNIAPLTIVDKSKLEEVLSLEDDSYEGDDFASAFLERLQKYENRKRGMVGHETIHGIRGFAGIDRGYHFEELIGYSNAPQHMDVWKQYFSGIARSIGLSLFRPLWSLSRLSEYSHLKSKVESGVVENIPLPMLVRIIAYEFGYVTRQIEAGREVKTVVNEKAERKSTDSWRWQLIAELCGF